MSQVATAEPSSVKAPGGKWGKGISPNQSTSKVASRILGARLRSVWHWLPLAAEKSEEDVEHVHQLRIATRRAAEALRVFSNLIPEAVYEETRADLRKIRLAADEARNWDVLGDLFLQCPDVSAGGLVSKVLEEIKSRRREAQRPIVAIHQELAAKEFDEQIAKLVEEVQSSGEGKRKFGRQARQSLGSVLKKFFKAAEADLSGDEALHVLRIRTKKLRYTMEMVAPAFAPAFRKKLYDRISVLQDILGIVNDHAMGKAFFHEWSLKVPDAQGKAFLEGLVLAESRAHRDVRQALLALWTQEAVAGLGRRFRAYYGLS